MVLVAAIARTCELVPALNVVTSAPVAVSNAAMRYRACPEMLVKFPPT